jgi:hypothetical protein
MGYRGFLGVFVLSVGALYPGSAVAAHAQAPRCTTRQLEITVHGDDGGLGHGSEQLWFRNRGRPCTLHGYPRVLLLDRHGHIVGRARKTDFGYQGGLQEGPVPVIRLGRGQVANAMVEGMNSGTKLKPCPHYVAYRVTPPGGIGSVRVPTGTFCQTQVHPVVPGEQQIYPSVHD